MSSSSSAVRKTTGLLAKQLRHDLTVGLLHSWPKYVPVVLIFLIPAFQLASLMRSEAALGHLAASFTTGDLVLYAFRGMEVYTPAQGTPFQVPVVWLIVNLYLAYIIGNYPVQDLLGYGQQLLLRSRRRGLWWAGKCVWNLASVLTYYAAGWLTLLLATPLLGGTLSLIPTQALTALHMRASAYIAKDLLLSAAVLPVLTSIALSLMQMGVMMYFKSLGGYVAVVCVTASSAYFFTPLLIGNCSMLLRSRLIRTDGIDFAVSVLSCLSVCLLAAAVGYLGFRNMDFLDKA